MVADASRAIITFPGFGPTFGSGDIFVADDANSNTDSDTHFGDTYSVPSEVQDRLTVLAGTEHFTPDEVEVFYLG